MSKFDRCSKGLYALKQTYDQSLLCTKFFIKSTYFFSCLLSDDWDVIRAKFEQDRKDIKKDCLRFVNLQNSIELLADAFPDPPLFLILLELLEHSNQWLSFFVTQNMHNLRHMLHDSKFYLVAFVLKEIVDNFEQVFLCFFLANYFSDFVQTFAQSYFYFLNLW